MTVDQRKQSSTLDLACIITEKDPVTFSQFRNYASDVLDLVARKNRIPGSLDCLNLQRQGASIKSDFPKLFAFEAYILTLKPEDRVPNSRIYHLQISDKTEGHTTGHLLTGFVSRNVVLSEELIWKDIISSLTNFT